VEWLRGVPLRENVIDWRSGNGFGRNIGVGNGGLE